MLLVGATNRFIQKPFLTTSLYQGFYSSIFAIFMIIGTIHFIQKETSSVLNINDLKTISLIFIFLAWGLSGGLKKFFTFKKKKTDDVNSGAKYG